MNTLKISDPVYYTPNTACLPEQWLRCSFGDLDFTGKEKLKSFLEDYLLDFSCDSADSLVFYASDFAYRLLISLYREIASRITVDSYRFFNWPEYESLLRSLYKQGDKKLQDDLQDINFLFIFDLTLSNKESIDYFGRILSVAYINRTKVFVATRLEGKIDTVLSSELIFLYSRKFIELKIT